MSVDTEQTDISTLPLQPPDIFYDLILLMDESGSMQTMKREPIESINIFTENFKKDSDLKSTLTLNFFSDKLKTLIKSTPLSHINMNDIPYNPAGSTALNDAIFLTIEENLKSDKHTHKIFVIFTDGQENSSTKYTKDDVKRKITEVENNYDWKIIFLGASIDSCQGGSDISINYDRIGQFNQNCPGDLLKLCRETSLSANNYCRSRTTGDNEAELKLNNSDILNSLKRQRSIPSTLNVDMPPNTLKLTRMFTSS